MTTQHARPARYDHCDNTCTVDCGHCKGNGPPVPVGQECQDCINLVYELDEVRDDLSVAERDIERLEDDITELQFEADGEASEDLKDEMAEMRVGLDCVLRDLDWRIGRLMAENPTPVMVNEEVSLRAIRDDLTDLLP